MGFEYFIVFLKSMLKGVWNILLIFGVEKLLGF